MSAVAPTAIHISDLDQPSPRITAISVRGVSWDAGDRHQVISEGLGLE